MKKVSYFNVRKELSGKYIVCIKDQLATKKRFKSEKEAVNYINSKPWELILVLNIFLNKNK